MKRKSTPNEKLYLMLHCSETLRNLEEEVGISKSELFRLSRAKTCRYESGKKITDYFDRWAKKLIRDLEARLSEESK